MPRRRNTGNTPPPGRHPQTSPASPASLARRTHPPHSDSRGYPLANTVDTPRANGARPAGNAPLARSGNSASCGIVWRGWRRSHQHGAYGKGTACAPPRATALPVPASRQPPMNEQRRLTLRSSGNVGDDDPFHVASASAICRACLQHAICKHLRPHTHRACISRITAAAETREWRRCGILAGPTRRRQQRVGTPAHTAPPSAGSNASNASG